MAHYHIETELVRRLAARPDTKEIEEIRDFANKIKDDPTWAGSPNEPDWRKTPQTRQGPPLVSVPKGPYPKTVKEFYNTIDHLKNSIVENTNYMSNTKDENEIEECKRNISRAESMIRDFQFDIQYHLKDHTTTEDPKETYTNVMQDNARNKIRLATRPKRTKPVTQYRPPGPISRPEPYTTPLGDTRYKFPRPKEFFNSPKEEIYQYIRDLAYFGGLYGLDWAFDYIENNKITDQNAQEALKGKEKYINDWINTRYPAQCDRNEADDRIKGYVKCPSCGKKTRSDPCDHCHIPLITGIIRNRRNR